MIRKQGRWGTLAALAAGMMCGTAAAETATPAADAGPAVPEGLGVSNYDRSWLASMTGGRDPEQPRWFVIQPDVTLASKYMAHGMNIGGDEPVWQPSLAIDGILPGMTLKAWMNHPVDGDLDEFVEVDYLLMLQHTFDAKSPTAVNLHGYVDYWVYPFKGIEDDPGNDLDGWKFHAGISLPNLIQAGRVPVIPSYNYYFWTPRESGEFDRGGIHELFLFAPIPGDLLWLRTPGGQTIDLGASLNYHDGAFGFPSALSHATAHLSTTFNWRGILLTPAVNYQWSFEDAVNPEDELWASFSASVKF